MPKPAFSSIATMSVQAVAVQSRSDADLEVVPTAAAGVRTVISTHLPSKTTVHWIRADDVTPFTVTHTSLSGDGNPDVLPAITGRTASTRGVAPTAAELNEVTPKDNDQVQINLPDGTIELQVFMNGVWSVVDTDRAAPEILRCLSENLMARWWLAPQDINATDWPNRGVSGGSATIGGMGEKLVFDQVFTGLNTKNGNSAVVVPQPFAFNTAEKTTIFTSFVMEGDGGISNNRVIEAQAGNLGLRAAINGSNQISWSIGDGVNPRATGVTTALELNKRYTFALTFIGGDSVTAILFDELGVALSEITEDVSGFGDCTPVGNASVYGVGTVNVLYGVVGDFVVFHDAFDFDKQQGIAIGLSISSSEILASYREIYESRRVATTGTPGIQRTLKVVSPRDYGAVSEPGIDNTAALNAMFLASHEEGLAVDFEGQNYETDPLFLTPANNNIPLSLIHI